MVAIYGRSVEILLDREISQIEDISKIFSDKVMGEKAITRCFELGKEIRSATVRGQTFVQIEIHSKIIPNIRNSTACGKGNSRCVKVYTR